MTSTNRSMPLRYTKRLTTTIVTNGRLILMADKYHSAYFYWVCVVTGQAQIVVRQVHWEWLTRRADPMRHAALCSLCCDWSRVNYQIWYRTNEWHVPRVRDTNRVTDVGKWELEHFVHVNAARVCKAKHRVVGETRAVAHCARDEQTFQRNAREALKRCQSRSLMTCEEVPGSTWWQCTISICSRINIFLTSGNSMLNTMVGNELWL